ncbi:MAG: DUF308 domain-containing protein [Verrucomicrobia bacterium]|nr:DUF308 domain-containing protein [Verrucomicrobiota bacterium]
MNNLSLYFRDIESVRKNWGWFLALGLLLVALGAGVVSSAYYATVFSVVLFGALLICTGVVQFIQAFLARKWSGIFLALFLSVLYLVTGVMCVSNPTMSAIGLTLGIAAFCFVAGIFRMLASLMLRFDHWGWVFFNGLVTFILGILIYSDWPVSGLWLIGLFIGIDIILSGWSWIFLSLAARLKK